MLACSDGAETLEIPLKLKGRHALDIGIYRPEWAFTEFDIRLSTAPLWRRVRSAYFINDPGGGIQDVALDPADCAGASLLIRPVRGRSGGICGIRFSATPERQEWMNGHAGAVIDNHGIFADYHMETAEDIEATLAPFVESDFSMICWGACGGSMRMLYPSKVAPYFGEGVTDFCNRINRLIAENLGRLLKNGVDPLRVAVDFVQKNGMEFWVDDRICHMYAPEKHKGNFASQFQLDHPECLTRLPNGAPGHLFSIATEPFIEYKLNIIREQALYGADGVYIDFCRFPHVIGFEDIVLQPFLKEHGDPRQYPELTGAWLAHRCSYGTEFMRRLRAMLDEVGRKTGKRIPLAVQLSDERQTLPGCKGFFDTNYVNGFDVATWAREGLIDIFAPSKSMDYGCISMDHFVKQVEGTSCSLWGCLGQHAVPLRPDDYDWEVFFSDNPEKKIMPIADMDGLRILRSAAEAYHQGAEGVFLWEAGPCPEVPAHWDYLRRLGHRDEIMTMFGPPVGFFDGRLRINQRQVCLSSSEN